MKTIKIILTTLFCLTLLSFTVSSSLLFQENFEDIGILKQSLLKPTQFNKTQKGTWLLLNGQELQKDSELFKLLKENFDLNVLTIKDNKYFLPNASGAFIRSSNVNGEGNDPNKTRLVGSVQKDAIKKHKHLVTNVASSKPTSKHYKTNIPSSGEWTYYKESETMSNDNAQGEVETRPINISMYTYIKISN